MFSKCILRNGTEHQIELTCDIYDIALCCLSATESVVRPSDFSFVRPCELQLQLKLKSFAITEIVLVHN